MGTPSENLRAVTSTCLATNCKIVQGAAYLWRTIMRTKTNQKLKSLLAHYQPLDDDLMYEQSLSIDINLRKFKTHW